ncbi:MAG: hypothetical protein NUV55_05780 [Sulfuricaulis sp.]|uniref:hypothetical protein n=1 Tax=Sulfuricaulis sp. TaxID=2003553 RepID=UPI0025E03389|nr:hypothetical protein [Sulfuricaulis sp.]MCR4346693.1 hypothetical protein [Sulfuricaulis sp.]
MNNIQPGARQAFLGSGYGIALNPESEVGFDMEPEIVQGLIQQLAAGETQH